MIAEDYVSFETAKLLKEKGFDERITSFYTESGLEGYMSALKSTKNTELNSGFVSRPTIQMAMKWLREKKQIFITIMFCDYPALEKSEWIPEVCTHDTIFDEPSVIAYPTYEEAAENAIKYCLENLI